MGRTRCRRAAAILLVLVAWLAASGGAPAFASLPPPGSTSPPQAFTTGLPWVDTKGDLIQGHNGSILNPDGGSTYYWVGQQLATTGDHTDAACYQSTDLVHWTPVPGFKLSTAGLPLPSPAQPANAYWLIGTTKIIEASQTASPSQFVIWAKMKVKNGTFPAVGDGFIDVATSSSPCGTYTWQQQPWQPLNLGVGDIGLFQDNATTGGPGTGTGYLLTTDSDGDPCQSGDFNCIEPGSSNPVMGCNSATETLSQTGWVASSNTTFSSGDAPANAIDGNLNTMFRTAADQASGMYFQVNLGSSQTFNQIVMDSGGSAGDYARGFNVEVSTDGTNFTSVATGARTSSPETVTFSLQTAQYIRVVLTAGVTTNPWSIAEFNVKKTCVIEWGVRIFRLQAGDTQIQPGGSLWDLHMSDGSGIEAPAMFENASTGTYYVLMSHATSWVPNPNLYSSSSHAAGPWNNTLQQIYVPGSSDTCDSQTMWVQPIQEPAQGNQTTPSTAYIYMGDRWDSSNFPDSVGDSGYAWLPLKFTDGMSLTISGKVPTLDCTIHSWSLTGATSTGWIKLPSFPDAMFTFTNVSTGKVMEMENANPPSVVDQAASPSNGQTQQQWQVVSAGTVPDGMGNNAVAPVYFITNVVHGYDLWADNGTIDGQPLDPMPGYNEWEFVSVTGSDGKQYLTLKNLMSHEFLDAPANGGQVDQSATNTASNQEWALSEVPSYWAFTSDGNVINQDGAPWFGSLGDHMPQITDVTGFAVTPDGEGYWLIESNGTVWNFGDAEPNITIAPPPTGGCTIQGVASDPAAEFWAYDNCGNVYEAGTQSTIVQQGACPGSSIAAIAAALPTGTPPQDGGYWLVCADGSVHAEDGAPNPTFTQPTVCANGAIKGAVTDPAAGFWVYDTCGDVSAEAGALSHGSQACAKGLTTAALAATPDGAGYWLDCSDGSVLYHGNATHGTSTIPAGVIGAAGNPNM